MSIEVNPDGVKCWYSDDTEADVVMRAETKVLKTILHGKNTFQRAFMSGEITAKVTLRHCACWIRYSNSAISS